MTDTTETTNACGELAQLMRAMRIDVDPPRASMRLEHLGALRRALLAAVEQVEEALAPAIVAAWHEGMTYVEISAASSYTSVTTITKIMREQGASPGTGNRALPKDWKKRAA